MTDHPLILKAVKDALANAQDNLHRSTAATRNGASAGDMALHREYEQAVRQWREALASLG